MATKINKPIGPIWIDGKIGIWPTPQYKIPLKLLKEITANNERIVLKSSFKNSAYRLKDMINGGIPVPHLHLGNEIVLLDKKSYAKYLQLAAKEIEGIKDIADVGKYIQF
jgi:hypothetical protein